MSTQKIQNSEAQRSNSTGGAGAVEVSYTICPVLVASHVAVEKGWLESEIKSVGGSLRYLWSLPQDQWLSHFTHTRVDQFRDGGNIPAIHARSLGKRTRLIGLTFSATGGRILTRVDAGVNSVRDLRGRRVGLYRRVKTDRVDFWRATAERGIGLALSVNGLTTKDVEWVDLPVDAPDYHSSDPVAKPFDRFNTTQNGLGHFGAEIEALVAKKVDAIYTSSGRSHGLERDGKVKAIEDLGRYPDWTLQIANSPYTITVSEDLAAAHPEVVSAYLRAAVRAGRWIEQNRDEAASILARILGSSSALCVARREIERYRFVPTLSPKNLAGLGIEKQFLLDHGYVAHDFELSQWVDASFLEDALRA